MIEPFDPLLAFFQWWMGGGMRGLFPSVHDGIARIGDYTGIILYRQPPFQVELWIVPPNTESPPHSHPGTDIFLVHITGEIKVWLGDELILGPAQTMPGSNGVTKSNGNFVRLPPGQMHRAGSGPLGAAFMNVQLWLDGKPRFTSEDWIGEGLNEAHKKKLKEQKLTAYVRSLRENSDFSTKEQPSISLKEQPLADPGEALREDSTQPPLIYGGDGLLPSAAEKSLEASRVEK